MFNSRTWAAAPFAITQTIFDLFAAGAVVGAAAVGAGSATAIYSNPVTPNAPSLASHATRGGAGDTYSAEAWASDRTNLQLERLQTDKACVLNSVLKALQTSENPVFDTFTLTEKGGTPPVDYIKIPAYANYMKKQESAAASSKEDPQHDALNRVLAMRPPATQREIAMDAWTMALTKTP